MFTTFLLAFANFLQPGVLWPDLAPYRPMWIIALLALLSGIRRPATFARLDALRHPAIKWMMMFLVVQAISVYRTGVAGMIDEFNYWLTYALFVLVALRLISNEKTLRAFVWGVMVGSAWLIFWGIWAVHAGIETDNGGRAGAYGMYENHNDYSFVVIQTLPFYYLLMRAESRKPAWLFLGVSTIASVAGIFLSLSRGAILALVLQALIIVWVTMSRRARFVLIPLVLAVGMAAISWQYAARAENQGNDYTAEDAETSRFELWNAGENMIKRNPLLGIGSRTFGEHSTEYGEISHDNLGKNSHNTFIEVASGSGLLGFVAFVMMLVASVRELRLPCGGTEWDDRMRQAAMIALVTISFRALFDAKPWDWSFFVLCTIAAASGAMRLANERAKASSPPSTIPEEPAASPGPPQRPPTNHLPAASIRS